MHNYMYVIRHEKIGLNCTQTTFVHIMACISFICKTCELYWNAIEVHGQIFVTMLSFNKSGEILCVVKPGFFMLGHMYLMHIVKVVC